MPTQDEIQALRTVAEDIEHLRDGWWDNPTDDVLRRGSAILRRFLADGVLQRAWKVAGFEREPTIVAPNLDELVGPDLSIIEFAFAGGAHLQGVVAAGGCLNRGDHPPQGGASAPTAMEYSFKLGAFRDSTAVIAKGQVVNRRELVKYFAHVKGGVHLDALSSKRRKEEEYLVRKLAGLEKAIVVLNKDAFHFELLSIGQAIGRAPDMQKLVSAIRAFQ